MFFLCTWATISWLQLYFRTVLSTACCQSEQWRTQTDVRVYADPSQASKASFSTGNKSSYGTCSYHRITVAVTFFFEVLHFNFALGFVWILKHLQKDLVCVCVLIRIGQDASVWNKAHIVKRQLCANASQVVMRNNTKLMWWVVFLINFYRYN